MTAKLKRINPDLNRLAAQIVHRRHQYEAEQETRRLRTVVLELLKQGRKPADIANWMVARGGAIGAGERPTGSTDPPPALTPMQ